MLEYLKVIILCIPIIIISSCSKESPDDNTIEKVEIGNQVWMQRNLNVEEFRNGDVIPEAKTYEEWINACNESKPVWCYYENNTANGLKYGKLYNWFAVNDSRGLAPKGWHIPSESEWRVLISFLGGENIAGGKLKSKDGWAGQNAEFIGTNSSGWTGLPGGMRSGMEFDDFIDIEIEGVWWSSTEYNAEKAWNVYLWDDGFDASIADGDKIYGHSVRCLKD